MANQHDPSMARVRARFEASKMTLDELGLKMGYPADSARKSAWQFVRQTDDPRISMLRRFADAMGMPIGELVTGPKSAKKKGQPS